jgi:hypothetical protein
LVAWKELRLPIAEYLAEVVANPRLNREQRGRLALAWPALWFAEEETEAAWRKALCYSAEEWPAVREAFADVLERSDGTWGLAWMQRERLRQAAESQAQRERVGKRWGARAAIPGDTAVYRAIPDDTGVYPASASASTPRISRSRSSENGDEREYGAEFEAFWEAYRCERRRGKPQAFREWAVCRGSKIHEQIMTALEAYKATREWREGFMPEPARWLKKRPWDGPVQQEDAPW